MLGLAPAYVDGHRLWPALPTLQVAVNPSSNAFSSLRTSFTAVTHIASIILIVSPYLYVRTSHQSLFLISVHVIKIVASLILLHSLLLLRRHFALFHPGTTLYCPNASASHFRLYTINFIIKLSMVHCASELCQDFGTFQ